MPRNLCCASISRNLQRIPNSAATPLLFFQAKSLFQNILAINPLDGISCEELFYFSVCFQYFESNKGRGYHPTTSLADPHKGECPRHAAVLAFCAERVFVYINLLCTTGTLVYGRSFANAQEVAWHRDPSPRERMHHSSLWPRAEFFKRKWFIRSIDLPRHPEKGVCQAAELT